MRIIKSCLLIFLLCTLNHAFAGKPLWIFQALTPTSLSVPSNDTARIQYKVTNQSPKDVSLTMQPIQGLTQITAGTENCDNPILLKTGASCTLSLQVDGSQLNGPVTDGPVLCNQNSNLQCYRPSSSQILNITPGAAITEATISVSGSPLTLVADGTAGQLIVTNISSATVTALNIAPDFTGTAFENNLTIIQNTCDRVAKEESCIISIRPKNVLVSQGTFSVQGTNTNSYSVTSDIESSSTLTSVSPTSGTESGGTGVTLTGTGLSGATSITFGGTQATNINVVDSTTVTAVTPKHATGAVDVTVTTDTTATLTAGYTYETTAIGQPAYGGVIGCLNGGLTDLIAATTDYIDYQDNDKDRWVWGSYTVVTDATSTIDGASNTAAIVNSGGQPDKYAAKVCNDFEIDSQGNTPCKSGNACYSDWFLPAGNNNTSSGQLYCLYEHQDAIGNFVTSVTEYWSSTEYNAEFAWIVRFSTGASENGDTKDQDNNRVRCVRTFSP